MIEFFLVANYVNTVYKNKKKETKNIENLFNNDGSVTESLTENAVNIDALNFVMGIFSLIISIFSAKLAYECNSKASDASQIISVLFGFFFSGFYLVYYFVWHRILGNKC
jgi:hypothetical protein